MAGKKSKKVFSKKVLDVVEPIVEPIVEPELVVSNDANEAASKTTYEQLKTLSRRQVRQILFKVRFGREVDVPLAYFAPKLLDAIKEQIEGQFSIVDFSHKWDIHPTNPLMVIVPFQWKMSGGGYDQATGIMVPSAFTEQS